MSLFREPDAGKLPVRFDEREQETESSQIGLRWAWRKPPNTTTGRLQLMRLFSTLLALYPTTSPTRSGFFPYFRSEPSAALTPNPPAVAILNP